MLGERSEHVLDKYHIRLCLLSKDAPMRGCCPTYLGGEQLTRTMSHRSSYADFRMYDEPSGLSRRSMDTDSYYSNSND
jgi:hypothetical protein